MTPTQSVGTTSTVLMAGKHCLHRCCKGMASPTALADQTIEAYSGLLSKRPNIAVSTNRPFKK